MFSQHNLQKHRDNIIRGVRNPMKILDIVF